MNKVVKSRATGKKPAASKTKKTVKSPAKTTATKKTKKTSPAKKLSTEEIQARTAQKAYEIFEQRGFSHGNDFEDWLEAEKKVLVEM